MGKSVKNPSSDFCIFYVAVYSNVFIQQLFARYWFLLIVLWNHKISHISYVLIGKVLKKMGVNTNNQKPF